MTTVDDSRPEHERCDHSDLRRYLGALARDNLTRSLVWFPEMTGEKLLTLLIYGVAEEAGEVVGVFKKAHRGSPLDLEKAHGEMADLLVYLVLLGQQTGIDWAATLDAGLAKCEARWGKVEL